MSLKLCFEPNVYLISAQIIDDEQVFEFLSNNDAPFWRTDTGVPAEELVEIAGRLCYMSFKNPSPKTNAAYIKHLLEVGHGSVLEHAVFTLLIEGVSRSLTHELVRHRAGFAYSQLSQRYVDESDVAFVVPPALIGEAEQDVAAGHMWLCAMEDEQNRYRNIAEHLFEQYAHIEDKTARRKAAREAARSVLPNATETKIVVTANARAWRHLIEMRGNKAADAEIQRMAGKVLEVLAAVSPNIFGDYAVSEDEGITTQYRKV